MSPDDEAELLTTAIIANGDMVHHDAYFPFWRRHRGFCGGNVMKVKRA